jgi:disulfide bond formation protein DsbB
LITTRKGRRLANLGGALIAAALLGYAYFAQFVQGFEPCPLCIFQRVAMIVAGLVFLAAAAHAPRGVGARAYAILGVLANGTGAGIAGWHVHLQNLPPDQVPACGPGLEYMLDAFPLFDAVRMAFTGSGECAEINWAFLGLSMPAWVLIWFVALGTLAVIANWRRV